MSPALQVKFLRALQEREVVPVGATEPLKTDVRIIAATNRDLEQEIRKGTFRSDLYYRLNVITMHLPPLRERLDDVPLLAEYFLENFAHQRGARDASNGGARALNGKLRLTEDALAAMARYDWPGNVRELENALERAAVLTKSEAIDVDALPAKITQPVATRVVSERAPLNPTLEVIERAYILWVLDSEGGNKAKAAEVLGIDPSTLYRKLNRYGMEV
jgi:two-component system response regulator HydG